MGTKARKYQSLSEYVKAYYPDEASGQDLMEMEPDEIADVIAAAALEAAAKAATEAAGSAVTVKPATMPQSRRARR
jgi:hypothetical protein